MNYSTGKYVFLTLIAACSLLSTANADKAKKPDIKEKKMTAITAKIGIVDTRRLVSQDSEELKSASVEWQELFGKLQDTLKPAQKELADLEKKYREKGSELEAKQKSGVTSKESLREMYEKEIAPLEYQLQNQYQQLQRYSYDELAKAQAAVGPKIQRAIDAICEAQGWDFVIDKSAVPTRKVPSKFDITPEVLELVNKHYADEKAKKKNN